MVQQNGNITIVMNEIAHLILRRKLRGIYPQTNIHRLPSTTITIEKEQFADETFLRIHFN